LGGDQLFAGLMIGSVPVGSLMGITMCKWWFRRRTSFKSLMAALQVGTIVGNVLYALAGLMHFRYTLLASRFLVGLFNGFSLPSKYIGLTVGMKRRSEVIMYYSATSTLAYAAGPALAALLEYFMKSIRIHNLVLDSDTVPGWFMALVSSVFLVLLLLLFEDPPAEETVPMAGSGAPTGDRLPLAAMCAAFWHLCVSSAVLTVIEVYTVNLGQEHWGWSIAKTAWLLAGLMLCSGVANMSMGPLARRFISSDRMGVLGCTLFGCFACTFLLDLGLPSFPVQVGVLSIGLMLVLTMAGMGRAFVLALQSKLVPTSLKGRANDWSAVFMTIGRAAGSVIGAVLSPSTFGVVMLSLFASSALVCAMSHSRMQPSEKAD